MKNAKGITAAASAIVLALAISGAQAQNSNQDPSQSASQSANQLDQLSQSGVAQQLGISGQLSGAAGQLRASAQGYQAPAGSGQPAQTGLGGDTPTLLNGSDGSGSGVHVAEVPANIGQYKDLPAAQAPQGSGSPSSSGSSSSGGGNNISVGGVSMPGPWGNQYFAPVNSCSTKLSLGAVAGDLKCAGDFIWDGAYGAFAWAPVNAARYAYIGATDLISNPVGTLKNWGTAIGNGVVAGAKAAENGIVTGAKDAWNDITSIHL